MSQCLVQNSVNSVRKVEMERDSGGGGSSSRTHNQKKTLLLPSELVNEILLRLPVKTLVRFKSACKSWLFLISDPLFAKSHFDLAAARTERLVLIAPFAPKILSIDFNASLHSDSASAELNLNFLPRQSFYVEILGSCRGFLLLNCDSCIYVWNPSTGAHNSIDWPPNALCHTDFMFSIFIRGFGYDPSKDDYLVVFGSYNRFHVKPDDYETRIDIFSFRTKKWKQIEGTDLPYVSCSSDKDNQMGWLLNRAIHWLVFRHDVCVILGFDLTKRGVLELPLPADFEFPEFKHKSFEGAWRIAESMCGGAGPFDSSMGDEGIHGAVIVDQDYCCVC